MNVAAPSSGRRAEGHAVVEAVELDCGAYGALRQPGAAGAGVRAGELGPEPVEDAAELCRGLERPRRQHVGYRPPEVSGALNRGGVQ